MLKVIIVMLEGTAGVVGGVDENALYPSSVLGKQRLQRLKVVSLNQHVGGVRISRTVCVVRFEQAIRHGLRRLDVLISI